VMQQRREPCLLVPLRRLAHGGQSVRRGAPALCPGRGRLAAVPLGRGPLLHGLRRGLVPFVRPLLSSYCLVRLLIRVHVHLTASAFMNRPGPHRARMRSPRFRTKDVSACMGSTTAQSPDLASHYARSDVAFSSMERDRRPGSPVSQLNTQPAASPVNASRPPSRTKPRASLRAGAVG